MPPPQRLNPHLSTLSFQQFIDYILSFPLILVPAVGFSSWWIELCFSVPACLFRFGGGGLPWSQFSDGAKKSCWFLVCSAFFLIVRTGVITSKLFTCQTCLRVSSHEFQNPVMDKSSEVNQAELKSCLSYSLMLVWLGKVTYLCLDFLIHKMGFCLTGLWRWIQKMHFKH